jgi:hypothetical protein
MLTPESLLPIDRQSITRLAASRREHRDHPAAARLFQRLKVSGILLLRPIPAGIKAQLTEALYREQLALGVALYVDSTGRRHACLAKACDGWMWREWPMQRLLPDVKLPPASTPMRLVQHIVLWPSPLQTAHGTRFSDLHL